MSPQSMWEVAGSLREWIEAVDEETAAKEALVEVVSSLSSSSRERTSK
jgi:hypothetical protein